MMHHQGINLQHGCIFTPNDQDLLEHYLKPKVYGQKLPCNIVKEKMIYGPGANPWHVLDASSTQWISSGKFEKTVYVFTRVTSQAVLKASEKKSCGVGRKQCVKKAGCGTWRGKIGCNKMKQGDTIIGFKRQLVFEINDASKLGDGIGLDNVGFWKMDEYCLCGNDDFVLCRITLDTSKNAKVVSLCPKAVSSCSKKTEEDRKIISIDDSAEVSYDDDRSEIKIYEMKIDYSNLHISTICANKSVCGGDLESQGNVNKGLVEQVRDQGCIGGIIGFWTWIVS